MRIRVATFVLICALLALGAPAGAQQLEGARPTSTLGGPPPGPDLGGPVPNCVTEGFDDITVLPGWFMQNNSSPIGTTAWFQGNDTVFPAQSGPTTSYIAANFNNTAGTGTISNWLLTPELNLASIDTLSFWTRAVTASTFPDRLEVRYSTAGASTDVGTLATDVGDFTNLALEINPTLMVGGYPQVYTQFILDNTDIVSGTTGRVAFRYFVTGGGPTGNNSDYIGIDTFEFCEVVGPQEADLVLVKDCTVSGSVVMCLVEVTNLGPADATNVVVVDDIPVGLTWTADDCGAGPPVGQQLTWNAGNLPVNSSIACNIDLSVDPGTTGTLINTATAVADNADPVPANNTDDAEIVIGPDGPPAIPTLSTVGLLALVLVLALASLVLMRRRQQT